MHDVTFCQRMIWFRGHSCTSGSDDTGLHLKHVIQFWPQLSAASPKNRPQLSKVITTIVIIMLIEISINKYSPGVSIFLSASQWPQENNSTILRQTPVLSLRSHFIPYICYEERRRYTEDYLISCTGRQPSLTNRNQLNKCIKNDSQNDKQQHQQVLLSFLVIWLRKD